MQEEKTKLKWESVKLYGFGMVGALLIYLIFLGIVTASLK